MIKTGIVISILNRKAGIMTSSGEFVYIKINKVLPKIGEIHRGELYKKNLFLYKYAIAAASLMFIFISSVGAHTYYTPVTNIVLTMKPSISIEANRWNKIISCKALNSDGSLILNNIKLINKSIDAGLELIVKEAKTKNFINDKYANEKKVINVDIKCNKNSSIDISNFKNIIDRNNLNIKINAYSDNNKDIDITANNKKVDTSDSNNNNLKKEDTNKKSSIINNPIKKPSLNINTNKVEEKPSNNEKEIKKVIKPTINKNNKISEDHKISNDNESENKNPINDESSTILRSNYSNGIQKELHAEDNKSIGNVKTSNNDEKSEKPSYEIQEGK